MSKVKNKLGGLNDKGSLMKVERNKKIVLLKSSGATFKDLAVMFNLSPKRVKEIFYREKSK